MNDFSHSVAIVAVVAAVTAVFSVFRVRRKTENAGSRRVSWGCASFGDRRDARRLLFSQRDAAALSVRAPGTDRRSRRRDFAFLEKEHASKRRRRNAFVHGADATRLRLNWDCGALPSLFRADVGNATR